MPDNKSIATVIVLAVIVLSWSFGCNGAGTNKQFSPTNRQPTKSEPAATSSLTVPAAPVISATPTQSSPAQPARPSFNEYDCIDDCSGHEAGYEWAEENGIKDPDDCGGNSDSFIEGCETYAEEQMEEYEDEYSNDGYYNDGYYEDEYYEDY